MRTPCSYNEKPQTSRMALFFYLIRTRPSDMVSFDSCFFNNGITVQYSKVVALQPSHPILTYVTITRETVWF